MWYIYMILDDLMPEWEKLPKVTYDQQKNKQDSFKKFYHEALAKVRVYVL